MYELVFEGQVVDGLSRETVRANMARLFKASDEQIEKMFSGGRVVLKNRLDKPTALKYQAVIKKNGAICKIALMQKSTPSPAGEAPPERTSGKAGLSPSTATPSSGRPVEAEGGRLSLAGEKVDDILSGKSYTLAPPGTLLGTPKVVEPPIFQQVDALSIAPPGSDLDPIKPPPPPPAPDVSHLSVAPPGSDLGEIKRNKTVDVPDVSHIKLEP